VFAALFCIYLVGPILVFIPLSFNDKALFHYPIETYSFRWYEQLFASPEWRRALFNSLVVATIETALATFLGVLGAIGLWRAKFKGKNLIMMLLMMPMVVPNIIAGVSMYLAFARVGLDKTYTGLILAHAALASPLVVITVSATLARLDSAYLRAAASLGSSPVTSFWLVMLPLILPGVLTGAVFAFAISFDDVIASLFISGPAQRTLPVQMYARATDLFDLTIAAAAAVMLLVAILMMLAIEFLKKNDSLAVR
jgi:putative spermidine/putrescine transport system permease protein